MNQIKEEEGHLICPKHNKKIKIITMDSQMPFQDILLCSLCLEEKPQISKQILSLTQVKGLIKEKYNNTSQKGESKSKWVPFLVELKQKLILLKDQIMQKIDGIMNITFEWMALYNDEECEIDKINLLQEIQELYENNFNTCQTKIQFQEQNKAHLQKLTSMFQGLMQINIWRDCYNHLISLRTQSSSIYSKLSLTRQISDPRELQYEKQTPKELKLINKVNQQEVCHAIAFNKDGSMMASGCDSDLKVWNFDEGKLIEQTKLSGHTDTVMCIVMTKKFIVSGGNDKNIIIWKNIEDQWKMSQIQSQHTDYVLGLILNIVEDQLISCSRDYTIKVWKVNPQENVLLCDYTFDQKHTDSVYCIAMNPSETYLVSSSMDNFIILWEKSNAGKWTFKAQQLQKEFGYRMCFINETKFLWQPCKQSIIHVLNIENGQLKAKPELNVKLKDQNYDYLLFPTIFNTRRKLVIQKHSNFIYFLKEQNDNKLKMYLDPLDCKNLKNFGALTDDGEYLVIWCSGYNQFQVHKIIYQ